MSGCFSPLHWRWRNFPKPSIAAVQGRVFAGGLMITWPTDLIVASEDACFADPVTAFGTSAVELFMHPWELGARRAKELLLTGDVAAAPESRGGALLRHLLDLCGQSRTPFESRLSGRGAVHPVPRGVRPPAPPGRSPDGRGRGAVRRPPG